MALPHAHCANNPLPSREMITLLKKTIVLSNQGMNLLQASPTPNPALPDILIPSPPKHTRRVRPAKAATRSQAKASSTTAQQPKTPSLAAATIHKKPSPIELIRPDAADPILTEPSQSQAQNKIMQDDDFPVSLPAPVTFRSLARRDISENRPLSSLPPKSHDEQISSIRRNVESSESRKRPRTQVNVPREPGSYSDDEPPRVTSFPTSGFANLSSALGLNSSSSSINEPPAFGMRRDFSGQRIPWAQTHSQALATPGHQRTESGESFGSGKGRSLSRESRSSYPEEYRCFRLIDQTLREQSQFGMSMDVATPAPPPYHCEMNKTATQFLEEDDSFYAGRPLDHFDNNNVSEVLAIEDSMFHRVKFPGRSKKQADKVAFGGARIPDVKIYLESSGRC